MFFINFPCISLIWLLRAVNLLIFYILSFYFYIMIIKELNFLVLLFSMARLNYFLTFPTFFNLEKFMKSFVFIQSEQMLLSILFKYLLFFHFVCKYAIDSQPASLSLNEVNILLFGSIHKNSCRWNPQISVFLIPFIGKIIYQTSEVKKTLTKVNQYF